MAIVGATAASGAAGSVAKAAGLAGVAIGLQTRSILPSTTAIEVHRTPDRFRIRPLPQLHGKANDIPRAW